MIFLNITIAENRFIKSPKWGFHSKVSIHLITELVFRSIDWMSTLGLWPDTLQFPSSRALTTKSMLCLQVRQSLLYWNFLHVSCFFWPISWKAFNRFWWKFLVVSEVSFNGLYLNLVFIIEQCSQHHSLLILPY